MNVLVTGGSGFVCLNIVEKLLLEGADVTVYDRSLPPPAAMEAFFRLPGNLRIIQGEITDRAALEKTVSSCRITHVVHGAAVTPMDDVEKQAPDRVLAVNFGGTIQVLEVLRNHPEVRLIFISSMAACGTVQNEYASLPEDELFFFPDSSYGVAKFASEQMLRRYTAFYGIQAITIRLGAVFGPWEHPNATRTTMSPALRILQAFQASPVVTFNRQSREDWIYSRDVASAVWELFALPAWQYSSYCIVSGTPWDSARWCELIAQAQPGRFWRLSPEGEEPMVRFYSPRDRIHIEHPRIFREVPAYRPHTQEEAFYDYQCWLSEYPEFL